MNTIKIIFPIKYTKADPKMSDSVEVMMTGLQKLVDIGALKGKLDEILVNYDLQDDTGYAIAEINKEALVDASKLQTMNSSLAYPIDLDSIKESFKIDKNFSAATIQERLRMNSLEPRAKFRYMILDYKKYYQSNKEKLTKDPEQLRKLKDMFLVDMMGVFNQIMPALAEGKQLAQLTGLNNVSEGLLNISRDLSIAYRKALKQAKSGAISKANFTELQKQYANFMNLLIPQVFPGIEKIDGVGTPKSFSETEKEFGWLKVSANCSDKLREVIVNLKEYLTENDSVSIIFMLNGQPKKEIKFSKDNDVINSIDSGELKVSRSVEKLNSYSYFDDGRVRLFD